MNRLSFARNSTSESSPYSRGFKPIGLGSLTFGRLIFGRLIFGRLTFGSNILEPTIFVMLFVMLLIAFGWGNSATEARAQQPTIAGSVTGSQDLPTTSQPAPGQVSRDQASRDKDQASRDQASAASRTAEAITLAEAIERAQRNEPAFAAAIANAKVASLSRSIARSALLPSVTYHNQYLYTEAAHGSTGSANSSVGTASAGTPRFIANNAVHEYMSQGVVNENLGFQQFNAVASATAQSAIAQAELEIARRGLVLTVVGLYYGKIASDQKVVVAQRAAAEAADFSGNTRSREEAREVAHADVIKAQLQQQQRDRDLADARVQAERARLELAVLLFPDPHTSFSLSAATEPAPFATREEIDAIASKNNPELRSAIASLHAASLGVAGARAAYLPDLALNFTYGIDAPEFAVHAPDGTRNLGYSASGTLDIPVWDWFATHKRIKQSVALRDSARIQLSATQKRLIAQIDEFYNEASLARQQLHSFDISVQTARESLRLARLRYTSGETTVLEVVDAQTSLATQENAREDGIVRYQTALANLQILTGQSLTEAK